MATIKRGTTIVGLILLLSGIVGGGWGVYQQVTYSCETGYIISVDRIETNETVDPTAEQVTYDHLSPSEQRVFEEVVTTERTPRYQNITPLEQLDQKVITYRGEQYETNGIGVVDCFGNWRGLQFAGGLTALLGVIILGLTYWCRRLQ